jgi:hypothetical protein
MCESGGTEPTGASGSAGPPKYDPSWVERTVLEEVVYLHPTHLTLEEWLQRIANDPADSRETATIADAVGNLRRSCLLRQPKGGLVEPTHAALRAVSLLLGTP